MDRYIHVILWGREIGSLMWRKKEGESYFMYHPAYLSDLVSPFPLAAPKGNDRFRTYPGTDGKKFQHLPSFLADSLPDDWGNELFDQWVTTQKHLSRKDITPLDKLSFIGKRGMGALEFVPNIEMREVGEHIDVGALARLARKIAEQREKLVIEPDESITMQLLMTVGTSAGGRQPKAILAIHPKTREIHSGQVEGLEGYRYCILKFGDKVRSTGELEMTYYEMARQAGIEMMDSELWEVDGVKHFLTERFDRKDGKKLHTQTLAAMRPEAESYEDLLLVCRELRLPESSGKEVFRRMVFNYLANNTDDHDKNFSFVMNPQGQWQLSPAYDMTFIFNAGGYQPEREHCLRMRGMRCDWTKADVLAFARENGIVGAERILTEVVEAVGQFRTLAEKNGVAPIWIGCVEATIAKHLSAWGYAPSAGSGAETVREVHLEMTGRGVLKLCANVDGEEKHTFITKTKPEYAAAMEKGMVNIPKETLRRWVEKYLM